MTNSSHITNYKSSDFVRTFTADFLCRKSHYTNMSRRGVPKQINWYLREWMEVSGISGRGAQSKMMDLTGWSKATMSQLYNNKQDYSPEILNQAASVLNAEPWELLMPPERAMAIRQLQSSAETIVSLAHVNDQKKTGTDGE